MTRAVLSIGSNEGDRLAFLQGAVSGLAGRVRAVSPVYETDPWGPVAQPDYCNAVVVAEDPALDAWGWLTVAQRLEAAAGRTRAVHWGPRTLDVDVVTVLDDAGATVELGEPALTLPHPYAAVRAFVLVPWLAADPSATLAGRPVRDLVAALPAADRAEVRPTALRLRLPPPDPTR